MTEPLRKERSQHEAEKPRDPTQEKDNEKGGATPPNLRSASTQGRPRLVTSGYPSADEAEASRQTGSGFTRPGGAAPTSADDGDGERPLFPASQLSELRSRWDQIQARFVDEPRQAVRDADALVSAATESLTQAFAAERSQLERQWDSGDSVSTEDLRMTLQHYRAFFHRLLAA